MGAVRVAGALDCKETLPALLDLLRTADEPVAVQAAVSLGELGHYGDVAPDLEDPTEPPRAVETGAAMSPLTFYVLFAVLSAGLFMSGYLFRVQMEEPLSSGVGAVAGETLLRSLER